MRRKAHTLSGQGASSSTVVSESAPVSAYRTRTPSQTLKYVVIGDPASVLICVLLLRSFERPRSTRTRVQSPLPGVLAPPCCRAPPDCRYLPLQTPRASMTYCAAAPVEYCCCPVMRCPSRTANGLNLLLTTKWVPSSLRASSPIRNGSLRCPTWSST